ncbi:MAG TPA: hypothetical protein VF179_17025, partial [Thermoanaerobaculia bacterium]|nr:hypothetical protein [Thermoanaerobaculia bacterium]
ELIDEGACIVVERQLVDYSQKRVILRREPNVELFTAPEVAMVSQVIRALWNNDAKEVSHLSHRFVGWQDAALEEDIPFETVFLGDPQKFTLAEEEIQYGQRLAAEIGAH